MIATTSEMAIRPWDLLPYKDEAAPKRMQVRKGLLRQTTSALLWTFHRHMSAKEWVLLELALEVSRRPRSRCVLEMQEASIVSHRER